MMTGILPTTKVRDDTGICRPTPNLNSIRQSNIGGKIICGKRSGKSFVDVFDLSLKLASVLKEPKPALQ